MAALAKPIVVRSGPVAPLAGASGGGCGGRPEATRWRAPGASARSGPVALAGGTPADAGSALEVAGEVLGGPGSRPLPPGGVSSEFTAYAPTPTPTIAATAASNSGIDPRPAQATVTPDLDLAGLRSRPQLQSDDRTRPH
jgi:hypothetical protein